MKKILMILGGIFAVLLLLGSGCFYWAYRSGSAYQEQFFIAVESGDVKQVSALLHPALRQEVDEPVLAAWMTAVRKNLGQYRGLSRTSFGTSVQYDTDGKTVESKGTVKFENGTARSEIHYRDDLIVLFKVDSEQLPTDWFQGPEGTELYHRRGEEFLSNLLSDKIEAAHKMAHEEFRRIAPREKLEATMAKVRELAGTLESVVYKTERFVAKPKDQVLTVFYTVKFEKGEIPGKVEFQFVKMKGHIVRFELGASAKE